MTEKDKVKISKQNKIDSSSSIDKKFIPLNKDIVHSHNEDNCNCGGHHSDHEDSPHSHDHEHGACNCNSDDKKPSENKTLKESSLTKHYILKGLDCANCAGKIELGVNNFPNVEEALLNFSTSTLSVKVKNKSALNTVENDIKALVNKLEPHVLVIEKSSYNKNQAEEHDEGFKVSKIIPTVIGTVIFAIAMFFNFDKSVEFAMFMISYLLIGGDILLKALKGILKGQVFDENFLMSIATIGAVFIKEYPEAVAVMLFYKVGEAFQGIAVNRSRNSITALMDIRPDKANLKINNEIKVVSPEEVSIGDLIIVKPGEKIPLDGVIIDGSTMLDTSALTGESVPRKANVGDEVLSGSINKNSLITLKVTKDFAQSTVSKILDLVQNAGSKKAKTEKFISKFARYYTPIVVFSAIALALLGPVIFNGSFNDWLQRALIFLVVSCPCALVISIPLGFFGGIGSASANGVLVKGGNYLEALNEVDTIVFDKTGTLTKGVFEVTEVNLASDATLTKDDLLKYAAYIESFSTHPIATSITTAYKGEINKSMISNYEEIAGHGIKVLIDKKEALAGNSKLMDKFNIKYTKNASIGTIVYIAIDNKFQGSLTISDMLKDDSINAIKGFKEIGIKQTIMLTGDNKDVATAIGTKLGLDKVYSELLPQNKVEILEEVINSNKDIGKVAFVGDGVNDAPVLARADIGIAMGGLGSDAAIEAADIVLMTDEPSKIINAIKIAKYTKKIVTQNIIFALAIKIGVLVLSAFGLSTMWEAIFADVGVSVLAILNAMRVLKYKAK